MYRKMKLDIKKLENIFEKSESDFKKRYEKREKMFENNCPIDITIRKQFGKLV